NGGVETFTVTMQVRRYIEEFYDDPYCDIGTVVMHGPDRLLDPPHKIKCQLDRSLAFRLYFSHGVRGPDAMRINIVHPLACKVLLKDLDTSKPMTVEPNKGLPVE